MIPDLTLTDALIPNYLEFYDREAYNNEFALVQMTRSLKYKRNAFYSGFSLYALSYIGYKKSAKSLTSNIFLGLSFLGGGISLVALNKLSKEVGYFRKVLPRSLVV